MYVRIYHTQVRTGKMQVKQLLHRLSCPNYRGIFYTQGTNSELHITISFYIPSAFFVFLLKFEETSHPETNNYQIK